MATAFKSIEESLLPQLPRHDNHPRLDFGSVVIESKVAENSVGAEFLGRHLGLGMPVVVRILNADAKNSLLNFDRMVKETRKLGEVRHPNIAGVFDVGEIHGHPFMILEYVYGVPLIERIKVRPMAFSQALTLLLPVAEGLCEFWRKGLVHRAVTPHLIYLQARGTPKLDLTILRRNYTDAQFKAYWAPFLTDYWSPEEIQGQAVDPSSDMWSFGATLYHAVTGQTPFASATHSGVRSRIIMSDATDPRTILPEIPKPLRELLQTLLNKDVEDRFLSAEAFLASVRDVEQQISDQPIMRSRTNVMYSEVTLTASGRRQTGPIPKAGDVIGNCMLQKELGSGAFGTVYLARHKVLDIDVAVKLLSREAGESDSLFIDMFLREARTAARIRHPNVIGIYEAGEQHGQYYLIMEYAPGGSVWRRMKQRGGKLPITEAIQVAWGAASGLAAAERLNIIHRDIKPDNLMFGADDVLKLADLGMAKRCVSKAEVDAARQSLMADQISMKQGGAAMMGTPAYMAPEMVLEPENVDIRTDLYSLGVTLYHVLTGDLPFKGDSSVAILRKHLVEIPVSPSKIDPSIPEDLSKIVLKLMEKQPELRYQTIQQLTDELAAFV